MSNVHYHEKRFVDKESDETVNGVKTFTAPNFPKIDNSAILPTLQGQFATKQYVDNAAIGVGFVVLDVRILPNRMFPIESEYVGVHAEN